MTKTSDLLDQLREMVASKGGNLYGGESVTQEQHALQCAEIAFRERAPMYLVVAALLHDIGHLVQVDFEGAQQRGEDRYHEDLGRDFLNKWFGPDVTEPVRMHVAAKKYLCAVDPDYFNSLSPASVHTLKIQGGPMNEHEMAEFQANPHFKDAVRLRIWDDMAKDPEMETHDLEFFLNFVEKQVAA